MNIKKVLSAGAFVTAGLAAGAVIAFSGAANAATNDNAAAAQAAAVAPASATTTPPALPTNGTPPQRTDETVVTGSKADTLTAAAQAKVAGATVIRVETDADGAAYEVHMKKADGTLTTVLFNADLSVKSVEQGMGKGPKGGHPGDNDGDGPKAPAASSTPATQSN